MKVRVHLSGRYWSGKFRVFLLVNASCRGLLGDCLASSAPANTAATDRDLLSDRNVIAQCLPDKKNQILRECKSALSH